MASVDERVVVSDLDERGRAEALDLVDLGEDLVHRLHLVAVRQPDGCRAELAPPRAAALRLDGQAVVALDIEEGEPGQRSVAQGGPAPVPPAYPVGHGA